jgi:hypothetical protein
MKERPRPCFESTERETLYDQVSHQRLLAVVMQPDVDVHAIELATNSFGEYLFVTLSCRSGQLKSLYTFWGLGYHDHLERWITESWQWYESTRKVETVAIQPKDDAYAQIKEREAFVRAHITPPLKGLPSYP